MADRDPNRKTALDHYYNDFKHGWVDGGSDPTLDGVQSTLLDPNSLSLQLKFVMIMIKCRFSVWILIGHVVFGIGAEDLEAFFRAHHDWSHEKKSFSLVEGVVGSNLCQTNWLSQTVCRVSYHSPQWLTLERIVSSGG
ncbi:hypothetical protein E4U52_001223 [Claviceps spartinae]|nr:hypothetical protein E4U52_001223 [Claviceps spartinae]